MESSKDRHGKFSNAQKGRKIKTSVCALIIKKTPSEAQETGTLREGGSHYSGPRIEIGEPEFVGCFCVVVKTAEKGKDGSRKEVPSRGGRG